MEQYNQRNNIEKTGISDNIGTKILNVPLLRYFQLPTCKGKSRWTSREKLYQELGFESLQQRLWYKKLCCLFKITNNQSPRYLSQLVSSPNTRYFSPSPENIPQLWTKHDFFENSFFPSTIKEWNNLNPHIRKSKSISIFKSNILKFIRPKTNNVYHCHNPKEITLITRLRLGLSHLRERKFKHSFQDCLDPLCLCCNETETSTHYLLHCLTYTNERMTLLVILVITFILNSTIEYIVSTQRSEGSTLTPV